MRLFTIIITLFSFISCEQNELFQAYKGVENLAWSYHEPISFDVEIEDTTSLYNVDINIRHSGAYAYQNCWVWLHTEYPSGQKHSVRKELKFCNEEGTWYGSGLNNIFDVRNPVQNNAKFQEKGIYKFKIEQNMRINPLPNILDVGLRIERKKSFE